MSFFSKKYFSLRQSCFLNCKSILVLYVFFFLEEKSSLRQSCFVNGKSILVSLLFFHIIAEVDIFLKTKIDEMVKDSCSLSINGYILWLIERYLSILSSAFGEG